MWQVVACTFIRTSLSLGTGVFTSIRRRTSGDPYFVQTIAFIIVLTARTTSLSEPAQCFELPKEVNKQASNKTNAGYLAAYGIPTGCRRRLENLEPQSA
jgi:hypothetical protein